METWLQTISSTWKEKGGYGEMEKGLAGCFRDLGSVQDDVNTVKVLDTLSTKS